MGVELWKYFYFHFVRIFRSCSAILRIRQVLQFKWFFYEDEHLTFQLDFVFCVYFSLDNKNILSINLLNKLSSIFLDGGVKIALAKEIQAYWITEVSSKEQSISDDKIIEKDQEGRKGTRTSVKKSDLFSILWIIYAQIGSLVNSV